MESAHQSGKFENGLFEFTEGLACLWAELPCLVIEQDRSYNGFQITLLTTTVVVEHRTYSGHILR